jgi:hypothetical protein
MLFTSIALAGLAALASAAPRPDVPIGSRGLTWEPRDLQPREGKGRGSKDVTIVDTTFIKIDEKSRNKEKELIIFIQEKVIIKVRQNQY